MKLNSTIRIEGFGVVLVPYRECHVEKYHTWMKSVELRALTASEPLTIEDEYKMQQIWLKDEDKCTFIVMDDALYSQTNDEVISMIGDTNLFINSSNSAEVELMIAEKDFHRKGKGWNTVLCMIRYGIEQLNIHEFTAKISKMNLSSQFLFKKLNFVEESYSNAFQEYTYKLSITPTWKKWLLSEMKKHIVVPHLLTSEVTNSMQSSAKQMWIFGYGSLVWKVDFPHEERVVGYIKGYVRRFWQASVDHRGTPEKPGRVVTLIKTDNSEDKVWGTAYKVCDSLVSPGGKLDDRENKYNCRDVIPVITSGYHEETFNALVFIGTSNPSLMLGPASVDEIAVQIANSIGPSGLNDEYLFKLADFLREEAPQNVCQIDKEIFDIENSVKSILRIK